MSPKGWSVGFSNFSTSNDFGTTTNGSLALPHHSNILISPIFYENHWKKLLKIFVSTLLHTILPSLMDSHGQDDSGRSSQSMLPMLQLLMTEIDMNRLFMSSIVVAYCILFSNNPRTEMDKFLLKRDLLPTLQLLIT